VKYGVGINTTHNDSFILEKIEFPYIDGTIESHHCPREVYSPIPKTYSERVGNEYKKY